MNERRWKNRTLLRGDGEKGDPMYHSFPTLVDFEHNFEKEFELVIERNLRGKGPSLPLPSPPLALWFVLCFFCFISLATQEAVFCF